MQLVDCETQQMFSACLHNLVYALIKRYYFYVLVHIVIISGFLSLFIHIRILSIKPLFPVLKNDHEQQT